MRHLVMMLCLNLLFVPCVINAQELAFDLDEQATPGPDVERLDKLINRVAAFLQTHADCRVVITTSWNASGPAGSTTLGQGGQSSLTLSGRDRLRYEATSAGGGPRLLCVMDHGAITRLLLDDTANVFSRSSGGVAKLADDPFTASTLSGTGLDLLTRSDLHTQVMTNVSQVEWLGEQIVDGQPTDHFRAVWDQASTLEFWIRTGAQPVLIKTQRTLTPDTVADAPSLVTVTNDLVWELAPAIDEGTFRLDLPQDAIEVEDIYTFLLEGATRTLLGQPAPPIRLTTLRGQPWDLSEHLGKPLVLYFWATWTPIDPQEMPELVEFIEQYEQKGGTFVAINVGESAEAVRAAADRLNYDRTILIDPQRSAAAKYRVTSLPMAVLIGKQGRLQSVHVGNTPQGRELLKLELDRVLAGEDLTPPAEAP